MGKSTYFFIHFALLLGLFSSCQSQEKSIDRQPAVAGQFYPAGRIELKQMLVDLFEKAAPSGKVKNVIAIISPHAGYVFSGVVAASAFNQIDGGKQYENIFILGPSHHVAFVGAAVYSKGNYLTPLGPVSVNRECARELLKKSKVFVDRDDAHADEHSVEVQLPFLQFVMKKKFSIVPIVIGSGDIDVYTEIARVLKPYFNGNNLFIISTDFSHYPSYDDAVKVDMASADAVCSNSTTALYETLANNESLKIPKLATSMCGVSCVITLLAITEDDRSITYHKILYKNSGDAPVGGRNAVVGYHAIAVSRNEIDTTGKFDLTGANKKELLSIVRKTISLYIEKRQIPEIDASLFPRVLMTQSGAFVTLKKNGILRGCIGRFEASEPLYKVVQSMAIASATEDPRFRPVELSELSAIEIEISVLTPMKKIRSIDEIVMGTHGIYMKKGWHSGTFLPQVATETGWSKEEFLGHCAQDKAGIGWDGWKDAEIFIYEALVFGENEGANR
jgi:MEMO1 family protein